MSERQKSLLQLQAVGSHRYIEVLVRFPITATNTQHSQHKEERRLCDSQYQWVHSMVGWLQGRTSMVEECSGQEAERQRQTTDRQGERKRGGARDKKIPFQITCPTPPNQAHL